MFDIKTGVRQGCILSPFLFLITIDFIMTKVLDDASFGIEWGQKRLADLDFADDISSISHTLAGIQEMTNNIDTVGAKIELRINCEKTKAMKIGPDQHPRPSSSCNRTWITSRSFLIMEATCQATVIQSRMYAPGWEKLHPFSNGFVLYGHHLIIIIRCRLL